MFPRSPVLSILKHRVIPVALVAFLLAGVCGRTAAHPHLIRAITKDDAGDGKYYTSPDGKYSVRLVDLDAGGATLTLYHLRPQRRGSSHREIMFKPFQNTETFIWVPKQPHTLVFGSSGDSAGDYDKARLVLWNGGTRLHSLYHVNDPDAEWFEVDGVTLNGQTLVFRHSRLDDPGKGYRRQLTLTLPVPRRTHLPKH